MTATRRCAPPTTTACSSCHRAASTPARPPSASAGSCRSALDAGIHAGGRPILAWPLALPRPPAGHRLLHLLYALALGVVGGMVFSHFRSEEHTSELQSLMRISYAVFCWKKKKN